MATVVLLPQDCLPATKSRHKAGFSDALYGSDITTGARNTFQVLESHSFYQEQSRQKINLNRRGGWTATSGSLPQPEQGHVSNLVQKDIDVKKTKARRAAEPRDSKLACSKPAPNVPVFTILQRPKDKEVANEVIAKFLFEENKTRTTTALHDSKIDVMANESKRLSGASNMHVEAKSGGSYCKMGLSDPAGEGPKFQNSKLDVPKLQSLITKVDRSNSKDTKIERGKHHSVVSSPSKPMSVAKRNGHCRLDELVSAKGLNQMLSPKAIGEHKSLQAGGAMENFCWKLAHAKQPVNITREGGLARLKRASTDPQIVKCLVTHYRSNVIEIPNSGTKSFHGIIRTTSMSCPERWAGPAYSSSPAPSSLPLPKFSVLNQKISSTGGSPLSIEGSKTNLTQLPKAVPVFAVPAAPLGGNLDVASATRSLRRMLKLEPF